MTIYVDSLESWGWKIRGRVVKSCHMFTDSVDLEELHAFAESVGMKRAWFQLHRVAPHYDLVPSRRELAVMKGAVEVGRHRATEIWRARREAVNSIDAREARDSAGQASDGKKIVLDVVVKEEPWKR
jgi:hypothetical protein